MADVAPVRIELNRTGRMPVPQEMQTVKLACNAMATRFELVLHGENSISLRAAGEEAIREIQRIEAQLSLYRPSSEIAHVNAGAAREPVRVSPPVFDLLRRAKDLSAETGGAFDITIAPLMRCWGFMGGNGKFPDAAALSRARECIGMHQVHLNASDFTVRFERDGVMLDLGALGKGYAVEQAAELLTEQGVTSALIHGGTSTIYAIGRPPDADSWKVAIEAPAIREDARKSSAEMTLITAVPLVDESLSVSAVWGKSFEADGKTLGHVLDPRTGTPVSGAVLSAVVSRSATEGDAFSTALLVLGGGREQERICNLRSGMKTLLVGDAETGFRVEACGIALEHGGNWRAEERLGKEAR